MADKAIGELPKAASLNDDSKLVMEQNGEAMHFEGKAIKDYVAPYSASAQNAAAAAQSAYAGVKEAIENIPEGAATPILNDLTTGGTQMALSAEMGKLLAQRPNPNLLDNWYFADPINQRGQTEYTGGTYTIDRWRLSGNGGQSLKQESDGVLLTSTAQYGAYFTQYVDPDFVKQLAGKTICLSVKSGSRTAVFKFAIYVNDAWKTAVAVPDNGVASVVYTVPADAISMRVLIGAEEGAGSVKIHAVKLELGSVQTLAHQDSTGAWVLNDPPPNKALELEKCQYYYRIEHLLCRCIASNDGTAVFEVEKKMNMRTALYPSNITVMECTLHGVGALDPPGSVTAVWSGSSGTIRELYVANANIQVNTTYGLVLAIDCGL